MVVLRFVKFTKVIWVGSNSSRRVIALIDVKPVTVTGTVTAPPIHALEDPAVVMGAFRANNVPESIREHKRIMIYR